MALKSSEQIRAKRNKTITLSKEEIPKLKNQILVQSQLEKILSLQNSSDTKIQIDKILNKTINGDLLPILDFLPDEFADLIIIDPPYNLTKNFNGTTFNMRSNESYDNYLETWLPKVCRKLKSSGSLYICGDWKCTSNLQRALEKELSILNRITWQRGKGRGAKSNWKNGMEDIWFAVKNVHNYYFNLDAVKIKRKVIAPYKIDGKPKDWQESSQGNFRLTCPSNFWDDISVPFWSMSENTDHPTQKPEKLYAKLILASSKKNDIIFDPFLGSGTASVVAKKLNRRFLGIELNEEYCLLAQKRLNKADFDKTIQGYSDGIFWERNAKI